MYIFLHGGKEQQQNSMDMRNIGLLRHLNGTERLKAMTFGRN